MTLRRQAYDVVTRQLIDGQLAPGQFVTQRELSSRSGFPLGAIREMIPRLEAEGLIRAIPQRGLQVARPDVRLVRDAFELRELIELAALARFVGTATDRTVRAQREALESVRERARRTIDAELVAYAQEVDWSFHDVLVDALGNRLLADIHRVNSIRIRLMMTDRVTLSKDTLPPAVAEHAAVLEAIERRDADAAGEALRRHLASARRRALALGSETKAGPGVEASHAA